MVLHPKPFGARPQRLSEHTTQAAIFKNLEDRFVPEGLKYGLLARTAPGR